MSERTKANLWALLLLAQIILVCVVLGFAVFTLLTR